MKHAIQHVCFLALALGIGFCSPLPAMAEPLHGVAPYRAQDGIQYGTSLYVAPHQVVIHQEPDLASPVVETIAWEKALGSVRSEQSGQSLNPANVFVCYYPTLNVALMPVVSDTDTGWVQVVYNQPGQSTGWVSLNEQTELMKTSGDKATSDFMNQTLGWVEFMKLNAPTHGIYWLGNVKQEQRVIRISPDDSAKVIDITVIRNLKVRHVRGNWMLVEVLDFQNQTPMGWIRWRDEEGHILAFVDFAKRNQLPVFSTGY
jgi:hypothetical protein